MSPVRPVPAPTTEHFPWGLFRRPRPTGRWALILRTGTEAAARAAMLKLMDARVGHADWRVTRLPAEHDNVHEATTG